jgi:CRP/FNR family transcriptional regulator, cyclic AMP receptor protein
MRKVLQLLGVLEDSDIEWLMTEGRQRHVAAETTIITERQPIDSLFLLLEGELLVYTEAHGREPIARLYPGEIVGELSFVDAQLPTASVVAQRESWLLAIPRETLSSHLSKDTGFAARFYRSIAMFLADRLRTTVGRLGYGSVKQDAVAEEISEDSLDVVSVAARRFDKMLRKLRTDYQSAVI